MALILAPAKSYPAEAVVFLIRREISLHTAHSYSGTYQEEVHHVSGQCDVAVDIDGALPFTKRDNLSSHLQLCSGPEVAHPAPQSDLVQYAFDGVALSHVMCLG